MDGWVKETPGIVARASLTARASTDWRANAALVRQGFRPSVVRLHGTPEVMLARALQLRAQMLEWEAHGQVAAYTGTIKSLVTRYQTDTESPFRDLRHTTQTTYTKHLRLLVAAKGDLRSDSDHLTGGDIRRWYKEIAQDGTRQSYADPWSPYSRLWSPTAPAKATPIAPGCVRRCPRPGSRTVRPGPHA